MSNFTKTITDTYMSTIDSMANWKKGYASYGGMVLGGSLGVGTQYMMSDQDKPNLALGASLGMTAGAFGGSYMRNSGLYYRLGKNVDPNVTGLRDGINKGLKHANKKNVVDINWLDIVGGL